MASISSVLTLPDGATLAYEVQGSVHLGLATPIVLVCGMTSVRIDYERLVESLAKTRPVLLYDHRGMGDSALTPAQNEEITIELLARDLAAFFTHPLRLELPCFSWLLYGWYSVVAQQMLLLPWHAHDPLVLPFLVTHLFLACTRSVVLQSAGLPVGEPPSAGMRTPVEKLAIAKRIVGALFDPEWIEANRARFEVLLKRATDPLINRPSVVIAKHARALRNFKFAALLNKISPTTEIMIIHGHLDQVIPFHCGKDIVSHIPRAKFVEQGDRPGQVPSLEFGHFWYEYFPIRVWHDVIDSFMIGANCQALH